RRGHWRHYPSSRGGRRRRSSDRSLHLGQLLEIGVERGLLIRPALIPLTIGGLQILGGPIELGPVEEFCTGFEVFELRRGPGLAGRRGWRCGRVIGSGALGGSSPCAKDQDETDRS